ncbi:MAG: carboxypeptidase-like regulatory domain-containing protein [Candidatus Thermoplasmatota archaeon]
MKGALLLLALPAVLAGCFAGEPPQAALPTGQIDGAVLDHFLQPFGNQSVHLVQLGLVDQTSAFGGFTFREVPPGFYTLTTSLPTGQAATQVVDVEAGKITRVILQLLPLPTVAPYFRAYAYTSPGEAAEGGSMCSSCEWAVPLAADRPAEVTVEAMWASAPLMANSTKLDITITDGRGFALYNGYNLVSPFRVSIAGDDVHPEATELRMQVSFGNQVLPSTRDFTMDSVLTLYHGATKAQMFQVAA